MVKTDLTDGILWFDGTREVTPEKVPELLLTQVPIGKIVVSETNSDIDLFNSLSDEIIHVGKTKNIPLDMSWDIPKEYSDIDLEKFIISKLDLWAVFNLKTTDEYDTYEIRVKNELVEIGLRGIEMIFKTIIFMIDELKSSKTVWGVGRGSSCASLVLYLIGLHKVNPIKYGIPMTEFFH